MKQNVVGISVGSEDLYRDSPQGRAHNAGERADSSTIVRYITEVRKNITGTILQDVKVGNVDTYTAWALPENKDTIAAVDFLGHNGFPYFETDFNNSISNALRRLDGGLMTTKALAGKQPVWITARGGHGGQDPRREYDD